MSGNQVFKNFLQRLLYCWAITGANIEIGEDLEYKTVLKIC